MSGQEAGESSNSATKAPSKEQEAQQERDINSSDNQEVPPPPYTSTAASSSSTARPDNMIPLYDDVESDMLALATGDPNEIVPVPMIHSTEKQSFRNLIRGRTVVTRTVIVRKMPRSYYLAHYAKDAQGNYVGTGKPAADAGLVFVPSKSTPGDVLEQVRTVAFGKEHSIDGWVLPAGLAAIAMC
ncbi:hypothetical protein BU24DRAFT_89796 [Aaosphaeria arxii CBS 175.79]|uniref:Uncharacterized protein n=1 Tax=Aaosphaeria arxii CBS 175.79 TaxID=1450172 RepID=A0A6A5X7T8_9PLEO|nr:uncharacterized protein BU24DRAFT_89796 [Aaosphaeria arxii CBS 175.79]KAF2009018.1 hypothetical protein BU24DRAFT_89796 [Aaosphaeria arxii CBS 175.79]